MENASRALIIAGTVLIAILIISVAISIINLYGNYVAEAEQKRINQEITQYNAKFEKYAEKSYLKDSENEISIHDVITIFNLVKEYNERKLENGIILKLGNVILTEHIEAYSNIDSWKKYLEDDLKNEQTSAYKMNITDYYSDGTIKEIVIRKTR